ncbi:metal ABC transporter solute-binding protein, Zn/Mn family [Corynebacterium pseudopelargi]|uniref:Manganese ABC transporter substrate-binding lipoprotein n=1 Tax=Corynebacterium pseudopelargi TaxID=2080757 RepID=A0A3G6IS99_9CORY|nr:zinc ABC transporter substrate-binding protein [Corynebacterium pseudopelargi]AZA08489.1 Manganese ABC transporter substrate-binding lipoprotein precursor [Corynebacterium pseudopelargi]
MQQRLIATIAPIATIALTLGACSSAQEQDHNTIKVAASTNVWGGVVDGIVDDPNVQVETIIEGGAVDPHTFEPSAADMAKINEADLVVVNGGGYDAWAYQGIDDQKKIISAMPLDEGHDHGDHEDHGDHDAHEEHEAHEEHDGHEHHHHGGVNEHIWYDVHVVEHVAEEINKRLKEAGATTDPEPFMKDLESLHQQVHKLPKKRVAQTEPIADYLIEASDLEEVTPKGYRQATLNESEPSAADVAAFLEAINSGEVEVLVYNPQTENEMTKQLRKAAEDKDIPVVEIRETPEQGEGYIDFLSKAVDGLANATKN